jgi:hypothetical protein
MNCGCKVIAKKPFLAFIVKAKASILILLKFKPKMLFFWLLDDIELVDWTTTNKFARLWFCEDIHHLSILKLAIKKQFKNCPIGFFQASCLKMIQTMKKNQFVRFMCSHKKGTLLTSFHIHSFVVFHTDMQKNTIVICILTSRNHMISNMQDQLLQLVQLIQYHHASSFSTVITNEFIGEEFCLG